jgi:hypothetical protein
MWLSVFERHPLRETGMKLNMGIDEWREKFKVFKMLKALKVFKFL